MNARLVPQFLIALSYACLATGCGDATAHDNMMKECIADMNRMADEMEKMADAPSLNNVKERQESIARIGKELEAKANKLEKLPKITQERLEKKFKEEVDRAKARVQRAGAKLGVKS